MLRQTLLYLPAQLLGPLAMFVATVAWTHLLDAATYGVVAYVLAAQELVYMLTIAWWSLYVLRFRAGMDDDRRQRLAVADNAVVVGAAVVQAVIAAPLLAMLDTTVTVGLFLAATSMFVTRSLLTHYSEIARSEEAILTYTVAQLAGPLAGTLASFLVIALLEASATAALAGIALVQAVGLAVVAWRLGVAARLALPDRDVLGGAIAYGLPMLATGGFSWVATNGIRLAIDEIAGGAALGLFSVGWGLGQRVATVAAMLLTAAAFPLAVRLFESGDREGALKRLADNGSLLFALLAPTTAGVALVARPLAELMIAEPFRAATVAILPLAVLAGGLRNQRSHFADQAFLLHAATARLIPLTLIEGVGCVAGTVIGLGLGGDGLGGLVAATLGCTIGTALGAAATFLVAIRDHGLRPQWGAWGRILIATAVMAAGLAPIPWPGGVLGLSLEITVGAGLYAAALAMFFPAERRWTVARLRTLVASRRAA